MTEDNDKLLNDAKEPDTPPSDEWSDTKDIAPVEEGYGMISRMIGVFIEPYRAFKHIGAKPDIWGPLVFVFAILLIASLFTMNGMVDLTVKSTTEMLADRGMTTEMIEKTMIVTEWGVRLQAILTTITILIMWLLFALLTYIIGLVMGQEANYKSSLSVVAYSAFPAVLIKQGCIGTILFLSRNWTDLVDYQRAMMESSLSLYSLFGNPDMNTKLQALLISIDPFLIWSIILMAIGLKFANRTKISNAWWVAIIAYVIFIAASVPLTAMGLASMSS